MSTLKKEWDDNKGNIKRKCKVCKTEFSPVKWNQIICEKEICKKGAFVYAHYQASFKRWETWKKEAKAQGIIFHI